MIKFENITKKNAKVHNPNGFKYLINQEMLIVGGSTRLGKTKNFSKFDTP